MSDLTERLAYWQQVLRLVDWDIELIRVNARDIEEAAWGRTRISEEFHEAEIRIIHDTEAVRNTQDFGMAFDPDHTLVHELLHLVLDYWKVPNSCMEFDAKEAVLNRLASALVRLDRRGGTDATEQGRIEEHSRNGAEPPELAATETGSSGAQYGAQGAR